MLATANSSIRVLPSDVTSRIAAGEVVERPASIVKELAENALDAGTKSIHVEISDGGRKLVRVTDDGCGMNPADLELCILPHATSKLSSADQLHALNTLGFRGEALPSIASVSHFSITSRQRNAPDSAQAWRIEISGGQPGRPAAVPTAGAYGTTVEARELFFNLPARLKFLKTASSEASACCDALVRLSLARPDVAFSLTQDNHEIFSFPAVRLKTPAPALPVLEGCTAPPLAPAAYAQRARAALGRHLSEGLLELSLGIESASSHSASLPPGYRLYGLLSPPAKTQPNRNQIFLTVNGRSVKDRTLTSALLEAYRQMLPPRRYPVAVLFLDLPGGDVDINVHPTKSEVRFRSPGFMYSLLHQAVRSACGAPPNLNTENRQNVQAAAVSEAPPLRTYFAPEYNLWPKPVPQPIVIAEHPAPFESKPQAADLRPQTPDSGLQTPASSPPAFRVLGQAGGSFIVLEDETGVKIIDQHALHERILFELLLQQAQSNARADSQGLLLAETFEMSPAQAAFFSATPEAAEVLAELGFSVENFGPRTLAIRAVPAVLKSVRPAQLVESILAELAAPDRIAPDLNKSTGRARLRERAAYILSCKGALKAGERLSSDQMAALMEQFFRVVGARSGFTCPHGRPLALELSWTDLERAVGRK